MDRFLAFTTQKEPALTASVLSAVLLAILRPVMLIVAGLVIGPACSARPRSAASSRIRNARGG